MITMTLTGVDQVTQKLQRLEQPWVHVLMEAVAKKGDQILAQSQPLVPVLTGDLKQSGTREPPVQEGPYVRVDITYGKTPPLAYAAKQEFDVTLNHPRGGQAHFLQAPFFAAAPTFAPDIADAIRPALGMA